MIQIEKFALNRKEIYDMALKSGLVIEGYEIDTDFMDQLEKLASLIQEVTLIRVIAN